MKTQSCKAKGRNLQKFVASRIRELFGLPEEDVKSTSMGAGGMDVQLSAKARESFPYAVECKSHARMAIYNLYDQAKANSGELKPLLVVKANRRQPLVVLDWSDFEELLK